MVEFAANNNILETTSISSFFTHYRLNCKIDFDPDILVDNPEEDQAHTHGDCLSEIYDLITSKISFA
jgi:hypothetical protein